MNTIYKLHYTTKDGEENTLYIQQLPDGRWAYTIKAPLTWHSSDLKVILGIAKAIKDKENVIIHEDTIKELEKKK